METAILFAMVLGFLFVGVPVGLSLGLSSLLYVALFTTESLSSVAISLFGVGTGSFKLLLVAARELLEVGAELGARAHQLAARALPHLRRHALVALGGGLHLSLRR